MPLIRLEITTFLWVHHIFKPHFSCFFSGFFWLLSLSCIWYLFTFFRWKDYLVALKPRAEISQYYFFQIKKHQRSENNDQIQTKEQKDERRYFVSTFYFWSSTHFFHPWPLCRRRRRRRCICEHPGGGAGGGMECVTIVFSASKRLWSPGTRQSWHQSLEIIEEKWVPFEMVEWPHLVRSSKNSLLVEHVSWHWPFHASSSLLPFQTRPDFILLMLP